ncbi:MAG: hypothetical protein C5B59_13675 [Bacteroidetes bacterium]|nr:MAG: hypothetical protein C5B59_13675 [Bacteroidota bacterium]
MPRVKRDTSTLPVEGDVPVDAGGGMDASAGSVDVPPKGKRSTSSPSQRATSRKVKKPQVHRDVAVGEEGLVHTFVGPGVQIASEVAKNAGMPNRYAPTPSEIDDIFRPVERFVMRRLPVDMTSSRMAEWDADTRDMVLLATGLLGYGMRVAFDGNSDREPTGHTRRSKKTSGGAKTTPVPDADSGSVGPSIGPNGVVTVDSVQNVHAQTVAETAMADLWRQTIRPIDSGDA